MKQALQLLALLVLLTAGITWLATGANRGWTKTEVQTESVEPVTELRVLHTEKKFLPGVDFLGAAFGGAALLAGASLLFRKRKTNNQQPNNQ
jgi:LPXTG-motif cell wall-anchored protein